MVNFIKKFDSKYNQVYYVIKSEKKVKYKFEYVYRNWNNKIKIYTGDKFPSMLINAFTGFVFVYDPNVKIPMIPNMPNVEFKTDFVNFNKYFITDKGYNMILKLTGFKNCSPKINTELIKGFKITNYEKLDLSGLFDEFVKKQKKIKTAMEWYDFIIKNCPNIHYKKEISDTDFDKNIDKSDVMVLYDIHSKDEIKIIEKIESEFDDINCDITIYNCYSGLTERIKNEFEKRKLKIKIGPEYICVKFSDLKKIGLKYNILDFIS